MNATVTWVNGSTFMKDLNSGGPFQSKHSSRSFTIAVIRQPSVELFSLLFLSQKSSYFPPRVGSTSAWLPPNGVINQGSINLFTVNISKPRPLSQFNLAT